VRMREASAVSPYLIVMVTKRNGAWVATSFSAAREVA
jgi:hypothetical protein